MDLRAVADVLAATPVGGASGNWLIVRKKVLAGPYRFCLSLFFRLRCPPALELHRRPALWEYPPNSALLTDPNKAVAWSSSTSRTGSHIDSYLSPLISVTLQGLHFLRRS
jgi:hypothetical protein